MAGCKVKFCVYFASGMHKSWYSFEVKRWKIKVLSCETSQSSGVKCLLQVVIAYRSELGGFVVHHNMQQPHVNNFYSSFKTNDLNAFL